MKIQKDKLKFIVCLFLLEDFKKRRMLNSGKYFPEKNYIVVPFIFYYGRDKMYLNSFKKRLTKKQRRLFVTAVAVIAVSGSVGYKVYADIQTQKQTEQTQLLINKQASALKELQQEIQNLYSNENTDFLNKDVSKETVTSLQNKLSDIEKKYSNIPASSLTSLKTKYYTDVLTECTSSLKNVQDMLITQEQTNGLFSEMVIVGGTVSTNVAIKDDLKTDNVETAKNSYYKKGSKSEWQKAINTLLDQADEQLKQIEKSKQMLEKVFKDNKVINIDQENYDSAKTEINKIKNEKIKNELSESLKQVQNEIDKQEKERLEKEKAEQTITEEEIIVPSEVPVQNESMDSQPIISENATSSISVQNETPNNNWVPDTGNSSGTVSTPAPTPPTNNGSTGGGANSSNSSSGNGQTGGNQGNTTPTQPTVPSEPEQPSGPPAGWIVPLYPIGSSEFVDWLFDNGYSGYDHSGGYIRPY